MANRIVEQGRRAIDGNWPLLSHDVEASQILVRFVLSYTQWRKNRIPSIAEAVQELDAIVRDIQNIINGKRVFKTRIHRLEEFVRIAYSPSRSSIMEPLLFLANLS